MRPLVEEAGAPLHLASLCWGTREVQDQGAWRGVCSLHSHWPCLRGWRQKVCSAGCARLAMLALPSTRG